jgi:hypothetical protein
MAVSVVLCGPACGLAFEEDALDDGLLVVGESGGGLELKKKAATVEAA